MTADSAPAVRSAAPLVLIQDADLEYDPQEYEPLIAPILAGKADAVYNSRFSGAGAHRVCASGTRSATVF